MATAPQPVYTFEPESHTYKNANGKVILSVTQILEFSGFVDYGGVPEQVLDRKSKIGVAVHAACEFIDTPDKGELDWNTLDSQVVGYVLAYENFVRDYKFTPRFAELRGIAKVNGMDLAYTIDAGGTIDLGTNGKPLVFPALIERKCAYSEEAAWKYQMAGYELCAPKPVDRPYWTRLAVQLKPDGAYKVFKYENPRDREVFLSCLFLSHIKLAEGIKFEKR